MLVTPNGVDSRLWSADREKERVILFCGRLAPEKGVREAALGVERVLAERPGWRGVFILASSPCNDAYAAEVRAILARMGERVRVIPDAAHEQVRDHMASAAIAVAPTQGEESFGRVAVEAMASGAAVITSRASGFVEVVGEAGVLLERPDAEAVARELRGLVDEPERRIALSQAARRRIEERYDLARSVEAFDRMAAALLGDEEVRRSMDAPSRIG